MKRCIDWFFVVSWQTYFVKVEWERKFNIFIQLETDKDGEHNFFSVIYFRIYLVRNGRMVWRLINMIYALQNSASINIVNP